MTKATENYKRSYDEKEAGIYLSLAPSTLRQARCHGQRENHTPVPRHIKIGRAVRYLKEDLDNFLDDRRNESVAV